MICVCLEIINVKKHQQHPRGAQYRSTAMQPETAPAVSEMPLLIDLMLSRIRCQVNQAVITVLSSDIRLCQLYQWYNPFLCFFFKYFRFYQVNKPTIPVLSLPSSYISYMELWFPAIPSQQTNYRIYIQLYQVNLLQKVPIEVGCIPGVPGGTHHGPEPSSISLLFHTFAGFRGGLDPVEYGLCLLWDAYMCEIYSVNILIHLSLYVYSYISYLHTVSHDGKCNKL